MNHIQGIQRMRKDKERCIEIVRDAFDVEDAMRRIKAERLDK
jgi:DNA-binding FrmR family transcriptional regulator